MLASRVVRYGLSATASTNGSGLARQLCAGSLTEHRPPGVDPYVDLRPRTQREAAGARSRVLQVLPFIETAGACRAIARSRGRFPIQIYVLLAPCAVLLLWRRRGSRGCSIRVALGPRGRGALPGVCATLYGTPPLLSSRLAGVAHVRAEGPRGDRDAALGEQLADRSQAVALRPACANGTEKALDGLPFCGWSGWCCGRASSAR
jgi:hypothetical protein